MASLRLTLVVEKDAWHVGVGKSLYGIITSGASVKVMLVVKRPSFNHNSRTVSALHVSGMSQRALHRFVTASEMSGY